MEKYHYLGDIDLRHGGDFISLANFEYDFADCITVTDLDSATGWNDTYLIERIVICIPTIGGDLDVKRVNSMIDFCGYKVEGKTISDGRESYSLKSARGRLLLLDGIKCYGHYDNRGEEVVAIGKNTPDSFDGWTLNRRLRANTNLRKWVKREYGV